MYFAGQLWSILEKFKNKFHLNMNTIKKVFKEVRKFNSIMWFHLYICIHIYYTYIYLMANTYVIFIILYYIFKLIFIILLFLNNVS